MGERKESKANLVPNSRKYSVYQTDIETTSVPGSVGHIREGMESAPLFDLMRQDLNQKSRGYLSPFFERPNRSRI